MTYFMSFLSVIHKLPVAIVEYSQLPGRQTSQNLKEYRDRFQDILLRPWIQQDVQADNKQVQTYFDRSYHRLVLREENAIL